MKDFVRKAVVALVAAAAFRVIAQVIYLLSNQYYVGESPAPRIFSDAAVLLPVLYLNAWWRRNLAKHPTLSLWTRFIRHFLPLAPLLFWAAVLADYLYFYWFERITFLNFSDMITNGWLALFLGGLYVAADLGRFYLERYRDSLVELERFRKENVLTRLATLKAQVNPHFLFNSLNTLTSLIQEDQERATHFVRQISHVYRHILDSRDRDVIELKEEMEILESYAFLVRTRFEEGIQVEMKVDRESLNLMLPPMVVQMLLENAIKHNVISRKRPLLLEVFTAPGPTLVVRNNLQRKSTLEPSTQVGLANIKARYQFLTSRPVEVEETNTHFTVKLPLIAKT